MRKPVKEPGPQANANASRSEGVSACADSSSRTMGISRRVCPRGARSKRSVSSSSMRRAAEQPSEDVSSASSFTEWEIRYWEDYFNWDRI